MSIEEFHTLFEYARVGFILLVIPSTGLWVVGKNLRRAKAAKRWPSVPGVIIRSELVPDADSDPETKEISTYSVVRYEYEVNGKKMQSRQFSIIRDAALDLSPAEFVAMYPLGTGLRVYYNPADATDSAIDLAIPSRVKRRFINITLFAFGFTLVAILLFTPAGELLRKTWPKLVKH